MAAGSRGARLFQVRPGELAPIAILVGWYFCVIGAAFVGRAVRDSLFLAHLSAARLPAMYVVSPLVLTLVGLAYARVEGRVRRDRLVIGTAVVSGMVMLASRLLLATGDWIYYVLYVAVNVMSGLIIMQLWTVASDRFTSRDAKRLFGLIGAGGTAADIAVGAALSILAPRIGAEDLLYLCAGLLFAAAALAVLLGRVAGRVEAGGGASRRTLATGIRPRAAARAGGSAPEKRPPGASHLTLVGATLVCAVVVVTLVEFQFKAITAAHFGTDRAGMVTYFGDMSIATGVISLTIQLVATRWVLQRLGVAGALLILPLGLGLGEVGLMLAPGLIAATILKAGDETFRFTVNDAASQLLFLPVPSRARGRWKALVDNAWKPGAQLGLGLALLAYRAIAPGQVTPLVVTALGVIVIWSVLLIRLRAAYVRSLRETLRRRPDELDAAWRSDLGGDGAGSPFAVGGAAVSGEEIAALRDAIVGDDAAQRLAALELVRPRPGEPAGDLAQLAAVIAPICDHADPALRRAACAALAGTTSPSARATLRARLADDDAGVRTAALAAVLAGSGVDDAARDARKQLSALCTSDEPELRVAAAEVLAAAGAPAVAPGATLDGGAELARLIADPDAIVKRAAVAAAASIGARTLVRPLLESRLEDPVLADALAACGAGAEAKIAALLADDGLPIALRREIARALGLLATPVAITQLLDCLVAGDPAADSELRTAMLRALNRATRRTTVVGPDRARVRQLIDGELAIAYRALAAADGLGRVESVANPDGSRLAPPFLPGAPDGAAALMSNTLRERQDAGRDHVLMLLEALYPSAGIDTIAANLREPDAARRANAVEVLDATLDRDLRARVIPLVDESPRYAKLAAAAPTFPMPRQTSVAWVAELLADPAPWMLACTAYYAGVIGMTTVTSRLEQLLVHPDATVREAALVALSQLVDAARLRPLAATLVGDPFAALARRAATLAAPSDLGDARSVAP